MLKRPKHRMFATNQVLIPIAATIIGATLRDDLWLGKELDADWRRYLCAVPGRRQSPALAVHFEGKYVVAVLVRRQQKTSSGVDREVAGYLATRQHVLHKFQFTGVGVNGKNRDGIVAAI